MENFFDLAGKLTIFVWPRDNPSLSPSSLPSEVEIHASKADSVSTSTSSSRSYIQKAFREAVRLRDNNRCVLSGEPVRSKAGNVDAVHIFGVGPALADKRLAAGIVNAYDTGNGMLLEKSLHVAFDAYQWCMDEFLTVHVSEEGMEGALKEYSGRRVELSVGSFNHPPRELLRARFALDIEKQGK